METGQILQRVQRHVVLVYNTEIDHAWNLYQCMEEGNVH